MTQPDGLFPDRVVAMHRRAAAAGFRRSPTLDDILAGPSGRAPDKRLSLRSSALAIVGASIAMWAGIIALAFRLFG